MYVSSWCLRTALALYLGLGLLSGCAKQPAAAGSAPPGNPAATGWFRDVTDEVGIAFQHDCGASGRLYMPEITGSGAAWLDFDGDSDLDLYLVNANEHVLEPERRDGAPGNRLFRQD